MSNGNDTPPANLTWQQVAWRLVGVIGVAISIALPSWLNYIQTKSHTPLLQKGIQQSEENGNLAKENSNLIKEVHNEVKLDAKKQ